MPTYAMRTGGSLQFRLIRRGDPDPEPDALRIHRIFWLDFQGYGLTVLDDITGRITHDWRLEALPGLELGRVTLDDQPQTITRRDEHGPWGVEVRRGELKLRAESRWSEAGFRLPAGGWDKDFQEARAELHLPPGWRLIAALGADRAPGSWIVRWTLLDLFLVLITGLAAARLWGFPVGALAVLTLVLLWHEPDAPRGVWLGLLAVTTLERAMPSASWIRGARALVLVAQQLRQSLYPQLEPHGVAEVPSPYPQKAVSLPTLATTEAVPLLGKVEPSRRKKQGTLGPEADTAPRPPVRRGFDPDALAQTGPGLPEWTWNHVDLAWNGPVLRDQYLKLLLIPPGVTRLLNLLRVALLAILAMTLLGWRGLWPRFSVLLLGLFLTTPWAGAGLPATRSDRGAEDPLAKPAGVRDHVRRDCQPSPENHEGSHPRRARSPCRGPERHPTAGDRAMGTGRGPDRRTGSGASGRSRQRKFLAGARTRGAPDRAVGAPAGTHGNHSAAAAQTAPGGNRERGLRRPGSRPRRRTGSADPPAAPRSSFNRSAGTRLAPVLLHGGTYRGAGFRLGSHHAREPPFACGRGGDRRNSPCFPESQSSPHR